MTTGAATERVGADARHPARVDTDGDFVLDELLALPGVGPARRISSAKATQVALWRLDADGAGLTVTPRPGDLTEHDVPTQDDWVLLHKIETSGLFRPPVREHLAALTPSVGVAWLALAAHWTDLSQSCGDLRFLNAACKLTGAVWLHHQRTGDDDVQAGNAWHERGLTGQLAAVGRLLGGATDQLRWSLAHRMLLAEPTVTGGQTLRTDRLTGQGRARIVVLAGAGSRSAGRLVSAATVTGLPIEAVCWYAPSFGGPAASSNYASAWYPPAPPDPTPAPTMPDSIPATTAVTWDQVTEAIRVADADLVLLVGMPVVPARVLDTARLGVLNAHNGALPSHRGMDAVGWALLHNQPIVCSLHLARAVVDAGEVVAAHPVPVAPVDTLAARVKTTQLRLLLAGAAHVGATGALPDLTPQPAVGAQFYRLHPHLKRLLDASPYAYNHYPRWTVIQP
ncbi:MAG: hypothetical protein M3Q39_10695 [Actinomycetota bacterium]|nr:hypothetical protein [Actinomycetota bacterium]